MSWSLSAEDIAQAERRLLRLGIQCTPLVHSSQLDQLIGCTIYFKAENLQKTGSFKARGAANAASFYAKSAQVKGLVTHSSGNHGQALAWAARQCGLACCVVTPKNTPAAKTLPIQAYGAQLRSCEPTVKSREEECVKVKEELGYVYVSPFDNPLVVAGQSTVGRELLRQFIETHPSHEEPDAVFVSIGGGGLAAGVATALRYAGAKTKLFLCEPEGKQLKRQLVHEALDEPERDVVLTMADGIRVRHVGNTNRTLLLDVCSPEDSVVTVSESEIEEAMHLIWTYTKQLAEPSSGVPLAALRKVMSADKNRSGARIRHAVVVLCGGNVDVAMRK